MRKFSDLIQRGHVTVLAINAVDYNYPGTISMFCVFKYLFQLLEVIMGERLTFVVRE